MASRVLKWNTITKAKTAAIGYHARLPYLRMLPPAAVGIILILIIVNLTVWAGVAMLLHYHRTLLGSAVLAYTLGLRHALDADHISAIDLMTRRLIASGQRPVTVGMFFSLGHSTIVIITSVVVAATAATFSDQFDKFSYIGGIIGTSVSAVFLIALALMNSWILYKLIINLRKLIQSSAADEETDPLRSSGTGLLFNLFKGAFRAVDKPWKMYPLGVLFGLGFDTSSEIALLGIASIHAAKGTNIWLIMIFPLLFTAGMCLLDTVDGALMSALYTSSGFAQDHIAILYYSIVLTIITVIAAIVIGTLQVLSLILHVAEPSGRFWSGVEKVEDAYDIIGAAIVASFLLLGLLSMLLYKPWRNVVDRQMATQLVEQESLLNLSTQPQESFVTIDTGPSEPYQTELSNSQVQADYRLSDDLLL